MIKTIKLSLLCSAMVISLSQTAFANGHDLNVDTDATYYDDGDPSTNSPPESTNTSVINTVVGGYQNETTQQRSVAIGYVNTVHGLNSVAIGRENTVGQVNTVGATTGSATALGSHNNTTGDYSNAIGSRNTAGYFQEDDPATAEVETTVVTKRATAVGNNSTALANDSLAIGSSATAGKEVNTDNAGVITTTVSGANSIAIGTAAEALQDNAIALGAGAKAEYLNSTAIGAAAETTQDNQIMLGTATDTITAPGVYNRSNDAATSRLVTVDELGNLGSLETTAITVVGGNDAATLSAGQIAIKDGSITSSDLADGAVSYNKLGEDVKAKFSTHEQGIATAMAMANIPSLSGDSQYSIGLAMGAFEDEIGFAFGGSARLGDTGAIIQASLGQSGDTYSGAVGVSWAW